MFGATTNYPFNFANRFGIPMIESSAVTVNADNVSITLPNRVFRALSTNGVVAFRLNTEIPAAGAALPIVFTSNNFTQALTKVASEAAVGTDLPGVGVYLIWYDKNSNLMQLV